MFIKLYTDIRRNQKLAARRHPMFDKNRFAKVMIYSGIAFWAAYFLFFGCMLPFAFSESFPSMEPYHILNKGLIFFLIADFLFRFLLPTPIQEIKPYLLLPIRREKVMYVFLLRTGLDSLCLFWLFFFLPFALFSVTRFYGIAGIVGYCLGICLLMVVNSYWSMLIRVLKRQKFIHILWAVLVYGLLAALEFIPGTSFVSQASMNLGEGFILWKPWAFCITIFMIALLLWINYRVQLNLIRSELERTEDNKIRHISSYHFLTRYGNVGEYIRLELKMIFRNKLPRTQFWMFIALIIVFAALTATETYGKGSFMNNFACMYCYCVLGLTTLSQVMAIEGNYIDGLMVRKESIYNMLRAKYYLQCILLIIPFICCLVPVFMGSISLLMSIAYLFFTMGPIFALILQAAVYNDKTLPLNSGMMGKGSGGNLYQGLIVGCAFGLPLIINKVLVVLFEENTAFIIMIVIGIIGFLTHRFWIRNIYNRLMARKYKNMEKFRDSR